MTLYPVWTPAAPDDLLTLVRNEGHPSADFEWGVFSKALRDAADTNGVVRPNALRPLLRGKVAPRRIGAFTNRALSLGLVEYTGEWQASDDSAGRNGGKPMRIMRLIGELS